MNQLITFTAILQFGSSGFDEYVNSYLEIRNCNFNCSSYNCNTPICTKDCATFEFQEKRIIGMEAIEEMFSKMEKDANKEITDNNGILIKEKLISSMEKYDPKLLQFIDLNNNGLLDYKGMFKIEFARITH
jgi:hypothetical protein